MARPDEEVWFAVARGEGKRACITVERLADGNVCLDACTEAVVQGGEDGRPGPSGGVRRPPAGRGGSLPAISVDGEGNAACPGRLDGETVTVGAGPLRRR